MKNTKRMMAVIAATGLALGAMPGVANAQSAGLNLDLGLGLGDSLGLGVDLGAALGSGEGGSLEDIAGTGSEGLGTDSLGDLTGPDGSLEDLTGPEGSLADLTGPEGSLQGGSLQEGSLEDLTGPEGSLADLTGPEGSLEGGSLQEGSLEDLTGPEGSLEGGSLTALTGSLEELTGPEGSLEDLTGSLTGPEGSLEGLIAGSNAGSSEILDILETGSENVGSDILVQGSAGDEGSLQSDDIMTLGSLAGAGIAVGLAAQGGITLPPLPEINVGAVCQLPQEAIDFLKNNGSMDRDECLPEEQN